MGLCLWRYRSASPSSAAAATRLFLEHGYVPTTIDAIADAADVAVETVYARFRK